MNSNAAEAVPAIGNIYTNDTNDDSIEIGNSPPPREVNIVNIRSRSCSSITLVKRMPPLLTGIYILTVLLIIQWRLVPVLLLR